MWGKGEAQLNIKIQDVSRGQSDTTNILFLNSGKKKEADGNRLGGNQSKINLCRVLPTNGKRLKSNKRKTKEKKQGGKGEKYSGGECKGTF